MIKKGEEKITLSIRMPISLKNELENKSNEIGISLNSYLLILLQKEKNN